jgi:hypothetical protein
MGSGASPATAGLTYSTVPQRSRTTLSRRGRRMIRAGRTGSARSRWLAGRGHRVEVTDQRTVRRWKGEECPTIRAEAQQVSATIYFAGEASPSSRAWASSRARSSWSTSRPRRSVLTFSMSIPFAVVHSHDDGCGRNRLHRHPGRVEEPVGLPRVGAPRQEGCLIGGWGSRVSGHDWSRSPPSMRAAGCEWLHVDFDDEGCADSISTPAAFIQLPPASSTSLRHMTEDRQ